MSKFTTTVIRAGYPLSVFRYRDFSFVRASTTSVTMGVQMELVVLAWFILNLTDSPFLVGAISAARMALNIVALFAGAIADRVPRHKISAAADFLMAGFAGVMLLLIVSGQLETWHIAMLIGPLVGGILFHSFGPKGAFTAIAALYIALAPTI